MSSHPGAQRPVRRCGARTQAYHFRDPMWGPRVHLLTKASYGAFASFSVALSSAGFLPGHLRLRSGPTLAPLGGRGWSPALANVRKRIPRPARALAVTSLQPPRLSSSWCSCTALLALSFVGRGWLCRGISCQRIPRPFECTRGDDLATATSFCFSGDFSLIFPIYWKKGKMVGLIMYASRLAGFSSPRRVRRVCQGNAGLYGARHVFPTSPRIKNKYSKSLRPKKMFISLAAGGFCPASASPGCTNAARSATQGIHPLRLMPRAASSVLGQCRPQARAEGRV